MREFIVHLFLFIFILITTVSCKAEEPKPVWPIVIEINTTPGKQDTILANIAGVSYPMMDAAIAFRSTLRASQNYRSGIYVYDSKSITAYLDNPAKLAARIALLGLKDVYLSLSKSAIDGSDVTRRTWTRNFNKAAHLNGLTVWALRLSSSSAFVSDASINDECTKILTYNQAVAADEKFDAVSADWEPHILKQGGADTPSGIQYFWDSSTNYGIGGSNDMLLKRTLDMFTLAKQNLGSLPINEAIHYMYQNNFNSGLLSYGSTLQFLNKCSYVTVMCYTDTKEKVWSRGLSPVDNAQSKAKSVAVCVKTSLNTYGDGGDTSTSLYPKGWSYLIEALNYFYAQGATKTAFRGIDFFEFEGLEQLWSTTETSTSKAQPKISRSDFSYNHQTQTLKFDETEEMMRFELYALNGTLLLSRPLNMYGYLDVSSLTDGHYIVKQINKKGLPITFKFSK